MEKGWFVEHAETGSNVPLYYRPRPFGRPGLNWTTDHEQALRLARYEDAVTLAASLAVRTRILAHMWG